MPAPPLLAELSRRPFARFVVAGACGFITDASVLSALVLGAHVNPHMARFASFSGALLVTWMINRWWTFADAEPRKRRLPLYIGVQLAGAALNLAAYSAALELLPQLKAFPAAALIPAAIAGLTVTYLGSKHIAFARYDRPSAP